MSETQTTNIEDSDLTTHSADSNVGKKIISSTQAEIELGAKRQDRNALPYISASSCSPIGAVVPTKLSYETIESLNNFILDEVDTANFVKEKLGYNSRVAVCDAFSSEQVDAVALAIVQIEKGKGFILGDMAGTGKGRVVAGICRYALKQNKIPVFFTIGVNLFSDIYRDFEDIGGVNNDKDLPNPFIFNSDGKIEKQDREENLITLYKALKNEEIIKVCKKGEMPKNTNFIMSTYSQLSINTESAKNVNGIAKYDFLCKIAPNCIFVLDESHKAAGDGNVGKNMSSVLSLCSGVMFASATYSKVPKSLMMYIPHTDIVESAVRPKTIVDAVKDNGEVVQEYIAGLLVKSGQMIRRQRTFDGCDVSYKYINDKPKEHYYKMYDTLMELYNEIEEFSNSDLYKEAKNNAIHRYAQLEGVQIVDYNDKKPTKKEDKEDWERRNANKYYVDFTTTNALKGRFQWVENLLFSLKSVFVAEQVIELLNTKKEVEYIENNKISKIQTNYKPVIALRNTGESALRLLGYENGQKLSKSENDYAKTLIHIGKSLITSTLTFSPCVNNKQEKIVINDATIFDTDFNDLGTRYHKLLKDLSNATSGLPLSPIDAIVDIIESTIRPEWDKQYSGNKYYAVEEITKRSLNVKKIKDDEFIVTIPTKKTIVNKVLNFNNGNSDVIIINTSGSTGLSIHSNSKFVDKRPRVMLIQQVELDVNTEVQKWGRINRTGQVNKPAYRYIVSPIPTEIRKLMMLRRKLRSLDANTSGNAKQSSTQSEILDKEGNPIEDMTNKYGYQVLLDFLDEPQNSHYKAIQTDDWYEKNASNEEKFESYLRALEKMTCVEQELFYDEMNSAYTKLKAKKVEEDEWDIDADIEDLKSSTLNKKLMFQGNNENEFTKSVYIEDKFIQSKGKVYTKEELNNAINELLEGKRNDIWHNMILDEFDNYSENTILEIKESYGEPDLSNATTEEQKEKAIAQHNEKISNAVNHANDRLREVRIKLRYFRPDRAIAIPKVQEDLEDGWDSENNNGSRKQVPYYIGIVVGIKFLSKSGNKFTPMNIQLEMATMSRLKPRVKVSFTKQYDNLLNWIMQTNLSTNELNMAKDWQIPKSQDRDMMRVLSGEIFKGLEMANELFSTDNNYQSKKKLIKYTTATGGTESAVRLYTNTFKRLDNGKSPSFFNINSPSFIDYLTDLNIYQSRRVNIDNSNQFIESYKDASNIVHVRLYILTGLARGRKTPLKDVVSVLSVGEARKNMVDFMGDNGYINYQYFYKQSAEKEVKLKSAEHIVYHIDGDKLKPTLDYLFKNFGWIILLESEDGFTIRDAQDIYNPTEKESEEKAGEYKYYPSMPFDELNAPDNYIKGSFKESEFNKYGEITLAYPIALIYRPQFSVYPADISEVDAVRSILNQISDDEKKANYIKYVKESSDFADIGIFTQKTIGISPKYAIGNVSIYDAGRIISDNIDEASKKVEEAPKESKKVESKKEANVPKLPLDWETTQDFIIKLKSLI
jgi:hypothetical protein